MSTYSFIITVLFLIQTIIALSATHLLGKARKGWKKSQEDHIASLEKVVEELNILLEKSEEMKASLIELEEMLKLADMIPKKPL